MSNFEQEEEATLFGIRMFWMWGIAISALCLVIAALVTLTTPWFNNQERKGIESSHAFVQSKKEFLLKLAGDYDALNTSIAAHKDEPSFVDAAERQKKSLVARMKLEAESLPKEEVPPAVRGLIAP